MTQDQINNLVSDVVKLFPLPDTAVLIEEATSSLPFHIFGIGGGYGPTRGMLRDAIAEGRSREDVQTIYWTLILEGLEDDSTDPDICESIGTGDVRLMAQQLKDHLIKNHLFGY